MSLQRICLSLVTIALAASTAKAALISGPRSVGSFFTSDDGASHAIIGKSNGDVVEAFWFEGTGVGSSVIAHFDNIAAVSGFWSSWDGYRHGIVALHNGQIWDVRYHPCCGIFPTLLTNLSGWGDIKSMSAWTDPQQHTNIAFLTHWGTGNVLGVYQQGGNTPVSTTFVNIYQNDSAIDVTGHHEIWNATSMVSVAIGAPSHLEQIYWTDNQTPSNFFDILPNTNVPWATQFPGPGQPPQTVVSLSATDQFCYFCPQWGGAEQMDLVTSANQMKTFSVNNGGGLLFQDWNFVYGPLTRSITGPFLSPVGSSFRRNTLVAMSNGDIWDMNPMLSTGTPSWTFRFIGTF
jgi:hypothetical protein